MSTPPQDYREMFDHLWLKCFHLRGQEHRVRIAKIESGEVIGESGRKSKKPVLTLDWQRGSPPGVEKLPFAISKTDGKTIAGMYGPDPRAWFGKEVILFPTTTQLSGKTVECIRIRPTVPKQLTGKVREPGDDG
jgi:hypothetical protein